MTTSPVPLPLLTPNTVTANSLHIGHAGEIDGDLAAGPCLRRFTVAEATCPVPEVTCALWNVTGAAKDATS